MEDPVRKMKEALFAVIRQLEFGLIDDEQIVYGGVLIGENRYAKITVEFYDKETQG